ncbi:MAG: hypothetical protein ACLQPD_27640 [Desulfomonilaceae bacterium]
MKKFLVVSIVVAGLLISTFGPAFAFRSWDIPGTTGRYWDMTLPSGPEFVFMNYATGCFVPPQDDGFPPQWSYRWECPCAACAVPNPSK